MTNLSHLPSEVLKNPYALKLIKLPQRKASIIFYSKRYDEKTQRKRG